MYRPTLRCSDVFKDYLQSLADVTGLDKNQLIRLALFSAPFNKLFIAQIEQNASDVTLPSPTWEVFDSRLWMEQNPKLEGKGETSHDDNRRKTSITKVNGINERGTEENEQHRRQQQTERQQREICKREGGGISIRIG
ncbi:hypothetical protein [Bacillus seohaeanensis]|uniref:Uncharacterized protein n=1 Tax=Bacillus seohaeanensis TaxID=284580 RepID=A0ABW5RMY9_9BACI